MKFEYRKRIKKLTDLEYEPLNRTKTNFLFVDLLINKHSSTTNLNRGILSFTPNDVYKKSELIRFIHSCKCQTTI